MAMYAPDKDSKQVQHQGDAKMKKYINKRIYTDIESYLVTEIDEVNGTAMAIEVEKRIKPKMIPGGFAAHCPDLNREFAEAEPVIRKGGRNRPPLRTRGQRNKTENGHCHLQKRKSFQKQNADSLP